MKVLVLHSELGVLWGGGETFTTNLFRAFAERGHAVTAAFVANWNGSYPRTLPDCFDPLPLQGWWSRKPGQALLSAIGSQVPARFRSRWEFYQEAVCWRTIRWHNRRFQRRVESVFARRWHDYDAVYVNGNIPLAHAAAGRRPTLLMLPGPAGDDLVPLLERIPAVCSHDDGLASLRAQIGDRAHEIPLGLDRDLFSPGSSTARAELGWTADDVVIGFVGRLALIKGVDLLAEAFRGVARAHPSARLLIVGSGEEDRRIRTALEREIAAGVVHLEARTAQARLPYWYRAMDLLVMPSRYETMSNALLEAMACGVPFLATRVGGSRSLLHTKAGWLVEPESVSALTEELVERLRDREALRQAGCRAIRHVHERYSWSASAARLEAILASRLGVPA